MHPEIDPLYPARTRLVQCSPQIRSAYWGEKELHKLVDYGQSSWFVPKAAASLDALADACETAGIDLRIVSGFRGWTSQSRLYTRYCAWLDAGKPARGTPEYDSTHMHDLPVGKAGYGTHQSGRAFDLHIDKVANSVEELAEFWLLAESHGWQPFYSIKAPSLSHSERRHFDFLGEWKSVYERYGYTQAMICSTADTGLLGPAIILHRSRAIQAQLMRAGADLGLSGADGHLGPKSRAAARELGIVLVAPDSELWPALHELPTR